VTEPARPTRAEPNDRYEGPILPGQRWRSRGTSKHQFLLYTVLRFNGRSVKAVVEGHAHHGGKVYNIPEASWRGNYNLYKQAPDYDPARDYQVDPQPDPIEEAILEVKVHREAFAFGNTANAPDAPMWPDERREPGTVKSVTERTLVPPTRAGVLELLNVVEQNVREEREKMLAQNPPIEPAKPVEPAEPEPDTQITVDVPSPANAMSAWIEGGRQMVEALTSELASVTTKRDALQEQVSALDLQLDLIRGQRDQIEAAVLHAIAIAEGHPPTEPAEGVNLPGLTDEQKARIARPRTPEGSRFAPQPGKVTQKDWVLSRLEPGKHFRVAQVRDAFATEYGLTPDAATKNVSSLLGYQLKGRDKRYPAISRVESGVYYVLEPAPNASGV